MDCKEARILLAPHIMGDLDSDSRSHELQAHLFSCQACSQENKAIKETMEFIDEHKALFAEAFETTDKKKASEQEEMKRNWQGIQAKLAKIEAKEKQAKFRRLVVRVSAVAACLIVGISTFLTYSIYPKPKVALKPSVRIELVSDNGNILIPVDRQIVSSDELKTLIINGKHRIVMNTNTILAVELLRENSNTGCLVKLASGRIYTHVEHDGNPFVVDTVHGKAVITGTTFDVKVTDNSTTLIVSEGTVQLESEKGVVKVAAGQTSKIVGQSAPSIPLSRNTAMLTAWATGYKAKPALAQAEPNTDPWELPLLHRKIPVILEETDYENWVKQKRNWFKKQFPWIFQLKDALAKEGIEVDYPELLVKSGDVWQFVCLDVHAQPARFSVIDPNSLIKTASDYGFDKLWLLENVPAAKSAPETPASSDNSFIGLKAFERWLEYLDKKEELEALTSIYSYQAGKYLADTRSLIWFVVRDGKYDLTDKERAEVLALLQKEVTASCKCQNEVLYPQQEQELSCYEDKYQKSVSVIVEKIETMKALEERIAEYEIVK